MRARSGSSASAIGSDRRRVAHAKRNGRPGLRPERPRQTRDGAPASPSSPSSHDDRPPASAGARTPAASAASARVKPHATKPRRSASARIASLRVWLLSTPGAIHRMSWLSVGNSSASTGFGCNAGLANLPSKPKDLVKDFAEKRAVDGVSLDRPDRLDLRPPRPEWRRQDHDPANAPRNHRAVFGRSLRPRPHAPARGCAQDRLSARRSAASTHR